MTGPLTLAIEPGSHEVLRLEPGSPAPDWFRGPGFRALLESADELTLVLPEGRAPAGWVGPRQGGYRALRVVGVLDFALVGILADLSSCLARAGISILAFSTYDTDWLLVPGERLAEATEALAAAGHVVSGPTSEPGRP